jgi:Ca-activated chloride channel family protein
LLAQPALAGSRVFMVYPRAGGHWLGAFRIEDGTPLWELEIGHDVITAPIFAERALYLATFDGHVHCVEPRTGERLWSRVVRATSAPWIHGGEIYVAQREEEEPVAAGVRGHGPHAGSPAEACHVYTRDAGIARRRYQSKLAPYLSADWGAVRKSAAAREDAHVGFVQAPAAAKLGSISSLIGERGVYRAWRFQGSRPVVVDGVLYETTGDRLEARDLATVELLWNWQDAGALEGERRLTPPAVASRRVLAGTWDGRLLVWSADTGALIHEVNVGSPCHWQPVMSDGWIYAGLEDGTLVGADVQDLHCDGWPMWGGGPGHNGMQPAQEAERT